MRLLYYSICLRLLKQSERGEHAPFFGSVWMMMLDTAAASRCCARAMRRARLVGEILFICSGVFTVQRGKCKSPAGAAAGTAPSAGRFGGSFGAFHLS